MVNRSLIGIAGAHFVAGELSKKGYVATLTSRNTEGIDILASNKEGTKTIAIQVKTTTKKDWMLNKKAENLISEDLFYVFVYLKGENEMPEFFIVPSKEVAEQVREAHKKWLETLNRKGGEHKDNTIRIFKDTERKYKDKWDLLGLDKENEEEMKELRIRIIGESIKELEEELGKNNIRISYSTKESTELMFMMGAFSDIIIEYPLEIINGVVTLANISKIIYDWRERKKRGEYPKITNFNQTININVNENFDEMKRKLNEIAKEQSNFNEGVKKKFQE